MNIFLILFLLFTLVPLAELMILFNLGGMIGLFPTVALVLITGVIGASLAKMQGWQTFSKIQLDVSQGKMPTESLADGLMILIAGAFLITPGILTDIVGFGLLIPLFRKWVKQLMMQNIKSRIKVNVQSFGNFSEQQSSQKNDSFANHSADIIDVPFTRKKEN